MFFVQNHGVENQIMLNYYEAELSKFPSENMYIV